MMKSLYLTGLFGSIVLLIWAAGYMFFMLLIFGMGTPPPYLKADAAVILTGGGKRVEAGFELLDQGQVKQVFISGVHPAVRLKDLVLLSPYRDKDSFPEERITLGRMAVDTEGNAEEAIAWMLQHNVQSAVLVTASYHMPRALYEFHVRSGGKISLFPYSVTPEDFTPTKGRFWWLGLLEYNKLLARWLKSQADLPGRAQDRLTPTAESP